MSDISCCFSLPNGYLDTNANGDTICTWDDGSAIITDACSYTDVDDNSSNPFNWGGFNSFLSTLGSIAVPFLPFLFGTAQPPVGGAQSPTPDEYKNQQGLIVIVGFFILIALSVGAYLIIKKRR